MKQLRENWRSGGKDMALAKTTTRVLLLKLVNLEKKLDTVRLVLISCGIEFVEGAGLLIHLVERDTQRQSLHGLGLGE